MYKLITTILPLLLNYSEFDLIITQNKMLAYNRNVACNIYIALTYICFAIIFIYLITHLIYVIICIIKKKPFSKLKVGIILMIISFALMQYCYLEDIIYVPFFDILFVLSTILYGFCFILELYFF